MAMTKGALVGKQYTLTVQRRSFNISALSTGQDAWLGGFSKLKVRQAKWLKGVDTNQLLCNLYLDENDHYRDVCIVLQNTTVY